MSDRVVGVRSESGVVENVEVAGVISFVAVFLETEIACIHTDCKAFPVFRPPYWISGR